MMANYKTVMAFSIDTVLVRKLADLADAQGVSRSSLVETFIRNQIDQEGAARKAFSNPTIREAMLKAFFNPEVFRSMAKAFGDPAGTDDLAAMHPTLPDMLEAIGGNKRRKKRKSKVKK